MDTWKALYDVVNIHISLLVKGERVYTNQGEGLCCDLCTLTFDIAPNTCAEMICSDLYNAYGQNVSHLSNAVLIEARFM